jgi:hypothetical protein
MTLIARSIVTGVIAAAGALLMPALAAADHNGCRNDKEGEWRVPGTGYYAMREARRGAIAAWKHKVHEKYGVYVRWQDADKRRVRCKEDDGMTECEVEARPCAPHA